MSPKKLLDHAVISSTKNQSGFLLPVALFVMVVVGGMVLMMSKQVSQSASSDILNSISTQAFYAAESGAQAGMHELFFNDNDRQLVDGRCAALTISEVLNRQGLENCEITVVCECRYENGVACDSNNSANYLGLSSVDHSFYTINSHAQCGVSPVISQHRIEVGASL